MASHHLPLLMWTRDENKVGTHCDKHHTHTHTKTYVLMALLLLLPLLVVRKGRQGSQLQVGKRRMADSWPLELELLLAVHRL